MSEPQINTWNGTRLEDMSKDELATALIETNRRLTTAMALASRSAKLDADLVADATRYRWLRNGNAYRPEEEMIRGGDDLDVLCDEGAWEVETKSAAFQIDHDSLISSIERFLRRR